MKTRITALILFLALCVLVTGRNVVITNAVKQPVPIKVLGAGPAAATPTGSPIATATATATGTPSGGLADGDPVSTWLDSSGNGHTATGSGTTRPIFKTAIVNGKPVVRFTSAAFSVLELAPYSPNTSYTWFTVMKRTGATIVSVAGTNSGAEGPFSATNVFYCQNNDAYFGVPDTLGTGAFHVVTGFYQAGLQAAFYFDGTFVNSAGTPNITATTLSKIGAITAEGFWSDGDIAEIIQYSGPLALRAKLVLLLTALITTGELPPQAELDAMAGHREKIKKYLHQHGAKPTKAQLDAVVTPMAVGDRAGIEKYLGTKYGITVAGGTTVDPSTVAGLLGWWKADSLITQPNQIAGLKAWLKADAITGVADGFKLGTWLDSSGNGNNATQATAGLQPEYWKGSSSPNIGGLPVVRFGIPSVTYLNLTTPIPTGWTVLMASRAFGPSYAMPTISYSAGDAFAAMPYSDGNVYMGNNGDLQQLTGATNDALPHVYASVSGTTPSAFIDGTSYPVALLVHTATGNLNVVGTHYNGTALDTCTGQVAEVLVYDHALTTAERQAMERYLKVKYSTP